MQPLIEKNLLQPYKKTIDLYGQSAKDSIQKRVILGFFCSLYSRMCDINILIENKSFDSAQILMRVAFETQIYIIYLFKHSNELERKCNAYYYSSYQKYAYTLSQINKTSIETQSSIIQHSIKTHAFSADERKNNLASYLNFHRRKFRESIPVHSPKLSYEEMGPKDHFKSYPIDNRKWYNDDGKTKTFLNLVQSLKVLNQYAALYSPTSDIVHSDSISNHFQAINNELVFAETMDPLMLVFFRKSILDNIRRLRSLLDDKSQVNEYLNNARQAYLSNHINKKG